MRHGWKKPASVLMLALAVGGCSGGMPSAVYPVPAPSGYPLPVPPGYGSTGPTTAEAIAKTLDAPVTFRVPARVGLLDARATGYDPAMVRYGGGKYFTYASGESTLTEEESRALVAEAQTALVATGAVKELLVIPRGLADPGAGSEALRAVAARFQCDLLVVVTGSAGTVLVPDAAYGFWDRLWGDSIALRGEATASASALTTESGRLLRMFESQQTGESQILKRDDATGSLALAKDAEKRAWRDLIQQLAAALAAFKK